VRRGLIVAATAALFAIAGARFDEPAHAVIAAVYVSVLIVCAATDIIAYRVPNAVTYPAMAGALFVGATMPNAGLPSVLLGGLVVGGALLVPSLFTRGVGMGMGDVKLGTFVGLALGLDNAVGALFLTAIGGGLGAVLLLVTRLRHRGEPIPYAPFIAAGTLAVLFLEGTAFVSLAT
jgi:leader peptidase (prepilin peptidase)/N-methyltransferase